MGNYHRLPSLNSCTTCVVICLTDNIKSILKWRFAYIGKNQSICASTKCLMWLCCSACHIYICSKLLMQGVKLLVKMMSTTRYARNFSILNRRFGRATSRSYATVTELPRPPPPTEEPHVETFSAPSKPRLYYTRPPLKSDLPHIQVRGFQF